MENIIFQVIVVERFHVITSSLRHFLLDIWHLEPQGGRGTSISEGQGCSSENLNWNFKRVIMFRYRSRIPTKTSKEASFSLKQLHLPNCLLLKKKISKNFIKRHYHYTRDHDLSSSRIDVIWLSFITRGVLFVSLKVYSDIQSKMVLAWLKSLARQNTHVLQTTC